jgi:hypothetical protein
VGYLWGIPAEVLGGQGIFAGHHGLAAAGLSPSRKIRRFESFTCHHALKGPLTCGNASRGALLCTRWGIQTSVDQSVITAFGGRPRTVQTRKADGRGRRPRGMRGEVWVRAALLARPVRTMTCSDAQNGGLQCWRTFAPYDWAAVVWVGSERRPSDCLPNPWLGGPSSRALEAGMPCAV